jgi:hypothetical protein
VENEEPGLECDFYIIFQYYVLTECIIADLCEVNNESKTTRVNAATEYTRNMAKKVIEQMTLVFNMSFLDL